ncbi:MFS transporter [Pseudoduganella violacea]|uniref:MFS transporter n=1 Tax=Pseudoduganella violacea TaxID=1715466 RepID=A0A7W5FWW5_9BURK|nr:MFS transporter [Pseudoduganella violacea]MBB3122465.1 hypothetical protein [Pseudoduganella violacea]
MPAASRNSASWPARCKGHFRPLLDLSLFANARFVGVQVLAVAPAYAYIVLLVILPARFIGVEGYSVLDAGRMMIALSAPLLILPFIAGQLARWIDVGTLSGIGLLIAAAGLAWLGHSIASDGASRLLVMALIGIGIALPWGVMDALAVSVVDKERAGMAAGIFNAMRLAGDGIALAVVDATLSARILSELLGLAGAAPSGAGAGGEWAAAANRLVMGDMGNALRHLPAAGSAALRQAYEEAFRWQLLMLAVAAAITALLVFLLLSRVRTHD